MTQISRPWASTTPGDAGAYTDLQWQTLYQYIIGLGGHYADNGVFLGSGTPPDDGLTVQEQSPTAAAVDVLPGSALVRGIAYISTATEALTINANISGNPRIDTVVLEADFGLQTVRLAVEEGTPAASPAPPTLTQADSVLWQIPIADIAVANGFTVITDANITPRRLPINGGSALYHDNILNNSGATLETGDAVVWDTSADRAVTTTTTEDNKAVAGAWVGRTANGGYGRVLYKGIGWVDVDEAVTRGNIITTGTSAGRATIPTGSIILNGKLGRALQTTSGAGLVLCYINAEVVKNYDFVLIQNQQTSGTNGGTATSGSWLTRVLNTEVVDTGGIASVGSNQITLQPGRYSSYFVSTFALNVQGTRTRLRNITAGATLVQSANTINAVDSVGFGEFDLTVASAIELQYFCNTTGATTGQGLAASTGDVEVYASVMFIRHGETQ